MVITVVVPRSSIDVLIEALVVMVNALTSRFVTTTTGSGLTEAGREANAEAVAEAVEKA